VKFWSTTCILSKHRCELRQCFLCSWLFLLSAFCMAPINARAETSPFLEAVGHPVSISQWYPIPDFWDSLVEMNASRNAVNLEDWVGFEGADVWVIFLSGAHEVEFLPEFVHQIFQNLSEEQAVYKESRAMARLDVQFDSGRNLLIKLVFIDRFSQPMPEIACVVAASLMKDIVGGGDANVTELTAECADK
jgi:hypothetical protein